VRRASLTTLLNGSLSVVRALISFFTVSLLIRYLGKETYGLCLTITGIAYWLSATQGGLGQSLKNEMIRLRSEGRAQDEMASILFSSAFVLLGAGALGVGLILTFAVQYLPWAAILNYPAFDQDPAYLHLVIASIWIVLFTLPLSLVRATYSAFQLEYRLAPYLLAGLLTTFAFIAFGTWQRIGMVKVVSASLAANLLGLGAGLGAMAKALGVQPAWGHVNPRLLWNLASAGVWFFAIEIFSVVIFQADVFLVNLLRGQAQTTTFALHGQLFIYVQTAVTLLVAPYWSAFGEAWQNRDHQWLHRSVHRLALVTAGISVGGVTLLLAGGAALMARWSHGQVQWNPLLAGLIAANMVVQAVTGVYSTALGSAGIVREQAMVVGVQALFNAAACYVLIGRYGVAGGALASLGTFALTSGLYLPWKFTRVSRERRMTDTSIRDAGLAG
jgi:O-antigen/teichoic acid export membrane protein